MNKTDEREQAVATLVSTLRDLEESLGVTEPFASAAEAALSELACRTELFDDPALAVPEGSRGRLHELSMDDDDRFAVYLHATIEPLRSRPHDHGTWLLHAGVSGNQVHRVYERTDDGSDPGHAELREIERIEIGPGVVTSLLPNGIHAVEIGGDGDPTAHLMVYGKGLHALEDRQQYHPRTGRIEPMASFRR